MLVRCIVGIVGSDLLQCVFPVSGHSWKVPAHSSCSQHEHWWKEEDCVCHHGHQGETVALKAAGSGLPWEAGLGHLLTMLGLLSGGRQTLRPRCSEEGRYRSQQKGRRADGGGGEGSLSAWMMADDTVRPERWQISSLCPQVERVVTIMQNPRQYKIPDWFLNRQKDVKDGKYSQVGEQHSVHHTIWWRVTFQMWRKGHGRLRNHPWILSQIILRFDLNSTHLLRWEVFGWLHVSSAQSFRLVASLILSVWFRPKAFCCWTFERLVFKQ